MWDFPNPRIEPISLVSPALAGRFFTTEPPLISERLLLLLLSHFVADSVRPHRRQPTRLPRPWDSPGKNTGVGCHFLLQCVKVKSESEVAQSCPTLSDPMDCSLPGSSAQGIFHARGLEWGAIAFSKSYTSHIKLKLHKIKDKEKVLKEAKDKNSLPVEEQR